MEVSSTLLTQSRYYCAAFNSAIFDGPLRIYFNQSRESEGLKVYFFMKAQIESLNLDPEHLLLIMLYPSGAEFLHSFPRGQVPFAVEAFGQDWVVGMDLTCAEEKSWELHLKKILQLPRPLLNETPSLEV